MSLQTPLPSPATPVGGITPKPHPPIFQTTNVPNTYDLIVPSFSLSSVSLAIAAAIRASGSQREDVSPALKCLFLIPSRDSVFSEMAQMAEGETNFMQDLATSLDPTSRYTFLNYILENGKMGEWMAKGVMTPSVYEWTEYVEWCASVIVEESGMGMQFMRGEMVGMEQGSRSLDVALVNGDGSEGVVVRARRLFGSEAEGQEMDMMEATETLQNLCWNASSSLNLATLAQQNDELLATWEMEEQNRAVRAVL